MKGCVGFENGLVKIEVFLKMRYRRSEVSAVTPRQVNPTEWIIQSLPVNSLAQTIKGQYAKMGIKKSLIGMVAGLAIATAAFADDSDKRAQCSQNTNRLIATQIMKDNGYKPVDYLAQYLDWREAVKITYRNKYPLLFLNYTDMLCGSTWIELKDIKTSDEWKSLTNDFLYKYNLDAPGDRIRALHSMVDTKRKAE